MTTFTVSVIIDQSRDVIVKALMNPDNFPYWQKDLERFEVIEHKPGEAGSVGLLHYRSKGRSYIMEDKMIFCEPGKKYISRVTGDVITAEVETTLRSVGEKTEMEIKWTGRGKILLLRLMLPLLRGKMIRQSGEELETFKRLVETKGDDFR